jgi:hypothetical protein
MDGKNPITKKKCKSAFGNMNDYSDEYYDDYDDYEYGNNYELYTDESEYDSSDDDSSDDDDESVYEIEDDDTDESSLFSLPKDPIVQIYFVCLGILGIYILYRFMMKSKN